MVLEDADDYQVMQMCDRILVLDQGETVEDGTFEQLMTKKYVIFMGRPMVESGLGSRGGFFSSSLFFFFFVWAPLHQAPFAHLLLLPALWPIYTSSARVRPHN